MAGAHEPRTLTLYGGPVAVAVAAFAIGGAALLSPDFSLTANALSDLGARGEPTAALFNGGLIVAGLLGLPFLWCVWRTSERLVQRIGVALLAGSLISMALVGVFPLPAPEHGPVAISFFALFTYGLFVFGTGDVLAGRTTRGLAAIWFGVAHPTAWLVSFLIGFEGIALPELAGAGLLAGWVLLVYRSL